MKFKDIRSKVSKFFNENQQMKIINLLSDIFWSLRKYFLGVEINYPIEFLDNWKTIKNDSSLDKERNFTLYQLIKIHNEIFKNENTNIIEFGVSRGSSLITIAKFCKQHTDIIGIDSFGYYANEIKKISTTKFDTNYQGPEIAFNKKERFSNFTTQQLQKKISNLDEFQNKKIFLIKSHFPNVISQSDKDIISNKEYSFVYLDFDLYQSTLDALKFVFPRIKKNGIMLIDDYNFINQEGVKEAVKEFGGGESSIENFFQTQSGQLIFRK